MWGSGNKVTYELEGHRFLPRAGVFFWACINTFWLEFEKNLKLWLWTSQVMNVQKKKDFTLRARSCIARSMSAKFFCRRVSSFFMISFSWTDGPKKNRNIAGFELMQTSYWKNILPLNHHQYCSIFLHKGCGKIGLQLAFSLTHTHIHTHTHPADTFLSILVIEDAWGQIEVTVEEFASF